MSPHSKHGSRMYSGDTTHTIRTDSGHTGAKRTPPGRQGTAAGGTPVRPSRAARPRPHTQPAGLPHSTNAPDGALQSAVCGRAEAGHSGALHKPLPPPTHSKNTYSHTLHQQTTALLSRRQPQNTEVYTCTKLVVFVLAR
jgi:hypothetical protein